MGAIYYLYIKKIQVVFFHFLFLKIFYICIYFNFSSCKKVGILLGTEDILGAIIKS